MLIWNTMLKKTLRLKLGLLDKKKQKTTTKKRWSILVRPAIGLEVESGNPGADYSTNDLRSCHETGKSVLGSVSVKYNCVFSKQRALLPQCSPAHYIIYREGLHRL